MAEFEFVRSPAQSKSLRGAHPAIPVPPPVLDREALDECTLAGRVHRSEEYLENLKGKRRVCLHEDVAEAKRYKAEVRIAAMAGRLLRIAPRANADEVVALVMPRIEQQFQAMRLEFQQELQILRHETQEQFNEIQKQLRILQFNSAAASFNSSSFIPEAFIRPFVNDAELLPRGFPGTLRDFQGLTTAAARGFLQFYRVRLPGGQNAKRVLASHIGLRAAA